jgi:hypothetical protein
MAAVKLFQMENLHWGGHKHLKEKNEQGYAEDAKRTGKRMLIVNDLASGCDPHTSRIEKTHTW